MKIIKSRVRYKEPESLKTAKAQELNQKPYKPVYAGEYYDKNIDDGLAVHPVTTPEYEYRDPNVAQRVEKAKDTLINGRLVDPTEPSKGITYIPAGENAYFVRKVKGGMTSYSIEATCTNGVVVGTGYYFSGSTVTLTVTPNTHYHLASGCWSGLPTEAVVSSDYTTATWTATADVSGITCTCTEDAKHSIAYTAPTYGTVKMTVDGAEVTSPYTDYEGTEVVLTFTPASGRAFDYWSNGATHYTENPFTTNIGSAGDVTYSVTDHSTAWLLFEGESFSTISFTAGANIDVCDSDPNVSTNWMGWTAGDPHTVTNNKVYVRGKSGSTQIYGFTGSFDSVSGPVMSLVDYDDITVDLATRQFCQSYDTGRDWCTGLFSGTSIKDASGLILPAKTAERCYESMFEACNQLLHYSNLPELPSMDLSSGCYFKMFYNCQNLDGGPALPALLVPEMAYTLMFSLDVALQRLYGVGIAATSITGDSAMKDMFQGCTALTTAPTLYTETLPTATTDDNGCYAGMFNGCSLISTVYCNAANPSENGMKDWITGCAGTGFVKGSGEASAWSGLPTTVLPTGWAFIHQD